MLWSVYSDKYTVSVLSVENTRDIYTVYLSGAHDRV